MELYLVFFSFETFRAVFFITKAYSFYAHLPKLLPTTPPIPSPSFRSFCTEWCRCPLEFWFTMCEWPWSDWCDCLLLLCCWADLISWFFSFSCSSRSRRAYTFRIDEIQNRWLALLWVIVWINSRMGINMIKAIQYGHLVSNAWISRSLKCLQQQISVNIYLFVDFLDRSQLFLQFHSAILEPDFDLTLCEWQVVGDFYSASSSKVLVEMEFFL